MQPVSEWDVLKTWASQKNKGFFLDVSRDENHPVRITSTTPSWLGRVWMAVQSLFGLTSLESAALRAITLATETKPLGVENKKAIENLKEKVEHFNSRWYHFKKISPEIVKSLSKLIHQKEAEVKKPEAPPTPPKTHPRTELQKDKPFQSESSPNAPQQKQPEPEKPSSQQEKPPLTEVKPPAQDAKQPEPEKATEPEKIPVQPGKPRKQPLSGGKPSVRRRKGRKQPQQKTAEPAKSVIAPHEPQKPPLPEEKQPPTAPQHGIQPKTTKPQTQPSSGLTDEELAIIKKHSAEAAALVGPLYTPISAIYSYMYEPSARDNEEAKARKAKIKTGIDLIEKEFTMCQINGDGHCMFRAIAVSLLDRFKNDPKALSDLVRRVLPLVGEGTYKLPEPDRQKIEQSITHLNPELIHTIILDDPTMTSWVVFLRYLAASNLLSRPSETINRIDHMLDEIKDQALADEYYAHQSKLSALQRSEDVNQVAEINHAAETCQQKIVQRYLAEKTDMSGKDPLKTYGTQLELIHVSQALNLNIVPLNFTYSVANREFAYNSFPSGDFLSAEQAPKTNGIFLIFQDIHYSSLFPKTQ